MVMFLGLLTACGGNNGKSRMTASAAMVTENGMSKLNQNSAVIFPTYFSKFVVKKTDPVVGTWTNKRFVYSGLGRWEEVYETSFSPDGKVSHYGNRNFDKGTWTRVDENIVVAYFDDCAYTAVGGFTYRLPSYQVTYTYGENAKTLDRRTDREDKLIYESDGVFYEATDFDTYEEPLFYISDEYCVEYMDSDYYPYPEEIEYCTELEKELLSHAEDLISGKKVELERAGYTDILAPDGTELLVISGYNSASSWKGGVRIHLSWRNNQIVVDREESYGFHWDLPLVNRINDYQSGKFYVYISRETDTEGIGYGSYVDIGQSLKIDEETFAPLQVPFKGYEIYQENYPDVYSLWSPFDEEWWQDGGSYPEDEEAYGRRADWVITAVDDNPDEMLRKAVEKSGMNLEKRTYPWTPETKENVMELLRCPVADYYYQSDYYAAVYMRGEIGFYEKEILADGYWEEWVLMNPDEGGILPSLRW